MEFILSDAERLVEMTKLAKIKWKQKGLTKFFCQSHIAAHSIIECGADYGGQMSYAVKSTQTRSRVFGIAARIAFPIVFGGSLRPLHHVLSD